MNFRLEFISDTMQHWEMPGTCFDTVRARIKSQIYISMFISGKSLPSSLLMLNIYRAQSYVIKTGNYEHSHV